MTAYERKLDQILDEIFAYFTTDMPYETIARLSKLSVSTVWRIDQRITRLPRFKTIYALARAAGMELAVKVVKQLKLRA